MFLYLAFAVEFDAECCEVHVTFRKSAGGGTFFCVSLSLVLDLLQTGLSSSFLSTF